MLSLIVPKQIEIPPALADHLTIHEVANTQQDLFPVVDFNPKWPRPNTKPAEALRRMLNGERLTQPSFGFHGWRLSAYIKKLEYLGWLICRTDVSPPAGYKTQKPIRQYWLPTEVIRQILNLRGKTE